MQLRSVTYALCNFEGMQTFVLELLELVACYLFVGFFHSITEFFFFTEFKKQIVDNFVYILYEIVSRELVRLIELLG